MATELWDLISPTSTRAAADAALAIGKSKRLVRRLAIERSPRRSSRLKTLLFSRMGAIIAILYGFYLLLSLIMALPILALAFLQDLHELILFRLRKAFATSR